MISQCWLKHKASLSGLGCDNDLHEHVRVYMCVHVLVSVYVAVMAQWLGCRTRNHKVASSSPVTAMSSFGDWFTQP